MSYTPRGSKIKTEKSITVGQFTAPWCEEKEAWIFPGGEKVSNKTSNAYKEALACARRYAVKMDEAIRKLSDEPCKTFSVR